MRSLRALAAAALVALIVLALAWELWLAPLRPGGSLLALKALPLALPLGGILAGRRYTYQWSCMLILAYFAEGATRAWAEAGLARQLAALEVVLSLGFFAAAVSFARLSRAGA
ncbi:MAG TPA: DUF2069 domain-containing protein [Burkholderiales bacterium]|nr:DUF2069 domain-containing protein [Burkholderiales bacterium]